jgi:CRISPR-associated endonuclease Cas1
MDAHEANRGTRRRTAGRAMRTRPIVTPEDVERFLSETETTFSRSELAGGSVVIVDGQGASISVYDGHLRVRDGIGWYRRERSYNRATTRLSRLVVTADSGSLSIAALRWCHAIGVSVVLLDPHEPQILLAPAVAGVDDARLRRAQALAAGTETGLSLVVELLRAKLDGEASIVSDIFSDDATAGTIAELAVALADVETVEEARQIEATGASAYFGAWTGRPETAMRFARRDEKHVPRHWRTFTSRRSPLVAGNGNRRAAAPLNAICNFLFKLGEIECHLAALAVGLDAGLGVLHGDVRSRNSLSLDLLEPIRPAIERFALRLLAERVFTRADFTESADGSVRIAAGLRQELAASMPQWAEAVGPWAERISHTLALASDRPIPTPTRVTSARRRAGQTSVAATRRTRAERDAAARLSHPQRAPRPGSRPGGRAISVPHRCEGCGATLLHHQRRWCPECWPAQRAVAGATGSRRAREHLALPGAKAAKGSAISAGRAAARDARLLALGWEVDQWDSAILPGLRRRRVTALQVRAATGLSLARAYRLIEGRGIPRPAVWASLAHLAGVAPRE